MAHAQSCHFEACYGTFLLPNCRDLLEVCEAQLQFGTKAELPVFGGSRGPDISKSISDIQVIPPSDMQKHAALTCNHYHYLNIRISLGLFASAMQTCKSVHALVVLFYSSTALTVVSSCHCLQVNDNCVMSPGFLSEVDQRPAVPRLQHSGREQSQMA